MWSVVTKQSYQANVNIFVKLKNKSKKETLATESLVALAQINDKINLEYKTGKLVT